MTIDASDGQGMQVGDNNVQHNTFAPRAPLDPVALSHLNPHVAVSRLQQLSHDELVDFFAGAPADAVSEMLAVFLESDEARVVAFLGDINRRKATELIKPLIATVGWLASLPEASEAIARKAAAFKWLPAGGMESSWPRGYTRGYKGGRVFWHAGAVFAVSGVIQKYHAENLWLQFPIADQEPVPPSPYEADGVRQEFEDGFIYSSRNGVYRLDARNEECYASEGGSEGWLGFPVGEDEHKPHWGYIQPFEGGAIYSIPGISPLPRRAVRADMIAALRGVHHYPTSAEADAVSSSGATGRVQTFLIWEEGGGSSETAVYSTAAYGVVVVDPEIWVYYRGLGAESSWLGFPERPALVGESEARIQPFEGGNVYWDHDTATVGVSKKVDLLRSRDLRFKGKLGWPVSEEKRVGDSGADRIQFFENGVATLRDGQWDIWLRP